MGNTIELQEFLLAGGTLSQLQERYAISHRRHLQYPNLVLLKYSQIDSPMSELIVQQARGIILDESDNWRIVARGFDKFFNYGEGHAADIDWTTAKVQEKYDGSLIQVYEYNNCWNISTTGSPDASGFVSATKDLTFEDLFLHTYEAIGGALPKITPENINTTYLFELMTPYNQVVVPHGEGKLVLLAARNRVTGQFINAYLPRIPNVREYPLTTINEILESFKTIDGLKQEGYVVVDASGNRLKVKHPQYVAMHHLRNNMGPKWLAKVILTGESPEFLSVFSEYGAQLEEIKGRYLSLISDIETAYSKNKDLESQKDFALAVKGFPYANTLFALRAGKTPSVKQWLAEEKNFKSALLLLNVKDETAVVTDETPDIS